MRPVLFTDPEARRKVYDEVGTLIDTVPIYAPLGETIRRSPGSVARAVVDATFYVLDQQGDPYAAALLRILEQPWKQGEASRDRTGKERSPCITCPGCGASTDPRDGLWLDPRYHYNVPTLCPWLLAAQVLLGIEEAA